MEARIDCGKIRKLRVDSDMLVSHLSLELNLSSKMITRMENDHNYNPGVLTIYKVSSYFNVSLDSLLIKV
jgi:DNA-binding XRE family transcriptional regulator